MAKLSENIRGASYMFGAMCAFTINDAFMKAVLVEVPLFQAIFFRGLGAVACLLVICKTLGQLHFDFSRSDRRLIVLRTTGEVAGTYFFLTALQHLPIANVSAVLQALPLTVALSAAIFLREPLGWRRLTAILVGFVGVLLIIQPGGTDFSIFSLYALAAVACVTVRDIAMRQISNDVSAVFVALVAAIGVTCLGAVGSMFTDMREIHTLSALYILGAICSLVFAYICSVKAMRHGEISFVAPFRYTGLVVALILGAAFFDEWPNILTLIGASIVVATGLFTLYREAHFRTR